MLLCAERTRPVLSVPCHSLEFREMDETALRRRAPLRIGVRILRKDDYRNCAKSRERRFDVESCPWSTWRQQQSNVEIYTSCCRSSALSCRAEAHPSVGRRCKKIEPFTAHSQRARAASRALPAKSRSRILIVNGWVRSFRRYVYVDAGEVLCFEHRIVNRSEPPRINWGARLVLLW